MSAHEPYSIGYERTRLDHVMITVLDGQQKMYTEVIIETTLANAQTSGPWWASQSRSHERWQPSECVMLVGTSSVQLQRGLRYVCHFRTKLASVHVAPGKNVYP